MEAANLVEVVSNLTTGDRSKLTSLIQSGDLSSAVQLATAAIVTVDAPAQTRTENQDDLTKKRIEVILAEEIRSFVNCREWRLFKFTHKIFCNFCLVNNDKGLIAV